MELDSSLSIELSNGSAHKELENIASLSSLQIGNERPISPWWSNDTLDIDIGLYDPSSTLITLKEYSDYDSYSIVRDSYNPSLFTVKFISFDDEANISEFPN